MHRELKRYPNQRSLCAGACCRISYGSFDNNETSTTSGRTDDGTSPTKESGGKSVASVQKWISAVYAEYCAQPDAKPEDDDGEIGTEERLYMNLRVEQERRHRSNRILKIMVPNNMYRYCTLVWLLLYSAIIVQICVRLFVFSWRDGVVFASSLVWSGVISEWDVLWWSKYGNPVWMREKKDGEDHQGQITLVDFV